MPDKSRGDRRGQPRPDAERGHDTGPSPLALDGWLEFNRRKWGVRPWRVQLPAAATDGPSLEAVLYLDKRNQIIHPPRNPYLPIRFRSSPTDFPHRITKQWLDLSGELASTMKQHDVLNMITFVPGIDDVRAWQWEGFRAGLRYTYVVALPLAADQLDASIGSMIRKSERAGYTVDRTTDMDAVMSCILETERRNGFEHGLTAADLRLARDLLGDDHFRAYLCFDPNGEPASTAVNLHQVAAPTIGWIGGSRTAHLRSGVVALIERYMVEDSTVSGAAAYDLAGANMRTIAASKANWGGRLTPYCQIESFSRRRLARWSIDWWRYRRPRPAPE